MSFATDKNIFGSKAASLKWLSKAVAEGERFLGHNTWRVPEYNLMPIVSPDEVPLPEAPSRPSYAFYAVRSGSSVSLPGLMDTVLHVPGDQVPKVVRRVYKSFGNDGVQKFLEGMEYPPKGTGVIVQRMVPLTDTIFGVVFTCSPNGFPDPYLIYSDAPGDIVGSGTGQRRPAHPNFRWLALRWYDQFGTPPEIEIAYRKYDDKAVWYLLQIRDQKLTPSEKAAIEGKVFKAPDVSPITTIPGDGWAKITDEKQVAHIDEAEPSPTLDCIRNGAKLVIAETGNPYSHAAVIARTEGVGFGVGKLDVEVPLPYTYLDGNFYPGEIEIEFVDDTRDFELINSKVNWSILKGLVHGGKSPYNLTKEIPQLFITTLIRYKNYLFGEGDPIYLIEFAQVLAFLGYLTSLGESRHETRFGLLGVQKKGGRESVFQKAIAGQFDRPLEWLKFVEDVFIEGRFPGGGYAGPRWAQIARRSIEIAQFLAAFKEEPSRVTFSKVERSVTQAEHQVHNCAIFWDKFNSGRMGLEILTRFSSSRDWEDFEEKLLQIVGSVSTFYNRDIEFIENGLISLTGKPMEFKSFTPVDQPEYCMGKYAGYSYTIKEWKDKEEERKKRIQKQLEKDGKLDKKVHILYTPEPKKKEKSILDLKDPEPMDFDVPEPATLEKVDGDTSYVIKYDGTSTSNVTVTQKEDEAQEQEEDEYHDGPDKPKRAKKETNEDKDN